MPEEVHARNEQKTVSNSGNNDPFPQPMFADKLVGLKIGLYGNDNFFKQ